MNFLEKIKVKAKENLRTIVIPEGIDERVIKATEKILKENIAKIILLGDEKRIKRSAYKLKADIEEVDIIDPLKSKKLEEYAREYYKLRKSKGITKEEAKAIISDPVFYGAMMVRLGEAGGEVGGAINASAKVLRAALQIIKPASGVTTVFGCFIMVVPDCKFGEEGIFVFADTGVVQKPSCEQLAEIAVFSARMAKELVCLEPKVAMLSFSTKGSGQGKEVDKVRKATALAKEKEPQLLIDGELQVDAALIPEVASFKAPQSKVAGRANVLIFPDLNSGNIGYKLVQRLAKAHAIGPLLQGLNKPVNDLSRGCNVEDIVDTVAITAVQA